MRGGWPAAAVLTVALSASARGETITSVLGPVELKGVHTAMDGPSAAVIKKFDRPGWITAFSVHLLDAEKRSADHDGVHCHSILDSKSEPDEARMRYRSLGLSVENPHLLLSEGQTGIRFPDGFGVAVDTVSTYDLGGMLQNEDGSKEGAYTFEYKLEFADARTTPPLKPLTVLVVKIRDGSAPGAPHCGSVVWDVPPGRHSYEKSFEMPYASRVRYISTHVHRYIEKIELLDERTGKDLYQTRIALDDRGYPKETPSYSSAEGLPLEAGGRYVFKLTYDNRLDHPVAAMGMMLLYESP
ncbi:MAG: hypothetical protein ACHQ49_17705 [Elusimicrobiota bacterium]